jgi:hypothetical protein
LLLSNPASLLNKYLISAIDTEQVEDESASNRERYPGHIPTTVFQKVLLTAGSAAMALYNPERGG